jgi:hypothetical protein
VDELFVPRDCAHNMHGLCETTCDARTSTIDHQLMLGYHFPLGYFVLTLVTLLDPIEGNGSNGSKFAYEFFQQHLVNSLTTRTMEAMVAKSE